MKTVSFWKSTWLQAGLLALLLRGSFGAGGSLAAIDNFLTGYSDADVCALENKKLVQFSPDLGLLYIYQKGEGGAWVADQEYRGMQVSENPKVAVDGDTVVIAGCSGTGMACILEKNQTNGLWSTNATATAVPVMNNDEFDSVSVSDGTIVFGSAVSAKAFVFAKNNEGVWTKRQTIDSPDQAAPGFGQAVRVLGDYMVISAVDKKNNDGTCGSLLSECVSDDECCSGLCTGREGKAKKCRFCARKKELCNSSSDCCQSNAGRYCDPDSKQCLKCPAWGCPAETHPTPYGQVFAYKKDPSSGKWSIEDSDGISSPDRTNAFGLQVALTSTKIIIGAPGVTPAQTGYVAVYDRDSVPLYKQVDIINGMTESFGSLVAADDERILVSCEGGNVFVYSTNKLTEAKNSPINYGAYPTSLAVSGGEACVGISDQGAYVNSDSPVYPPPNQIITQPASGESNFFGDECAMDSQAQTMVVLGPYGKEVYIYGKTSSGTWDLEQMVQDPNTTSFAPSAAVEGNTIVYAACAGSDYSFCILEKQDNGSWPSIPIVIQPMKGEEGIAGRISTVTISEGTIFVGVNIATWRTFVYTKNTDGQWMQVQEIPPPTPGGGAFGQSVHVLGDKMVIGSPAQPIPFSPMEDRIVRAGEAYVYGKNTSSGLWEFEATLQAESPKFEGRFGWEAAITNSLIIVGAPAFQLSPDLYPFQPGSVHVFDKATLEPLTTITEGTNAFGDRFGWRVAANDDKILVGTMDNKFDGLGTVVPDASDSGFGGFKMYMYSATDFTRKVATPISFPDWPFSFSMGGSEVCVGLYSEGLELGPGPISEEIVGDMKKVMVYNLD